MIPEYLGASLALPTVTGIRPPREGNLPTATTSKLKGKFTLAATVTTLQQAHQQKLILRLRRGRRVRTHPTSFVRPLRPHRPDAIPNPDCVLT